MPDLCPAFTADNFAESADETSPLVFDDFSRRGDSAHTSRELIGAQRENRPYALYEADREAVGYASSLAGNRSPETPTTSEVRPWFAALSLEAQLEAQKWPRPCAELFAVLAARYPGDLITLTESGLLSNAALTFAAEALGETSVPGVDVLLAGLLRHKSAMVREGALYGLEQLAPAELPTILRRVAQRDASPAVRSVATDLLRSAE